MVATRPLTSLFRGGRESAMAGVEAVQQGVPLGSARPVREGQLNFERLRTRAETLNFYG